MPVFRFPFPFQNMPWGGALQKHTKNALFTEPPTRKMITFLLHKKLAKSTLFWQPDHTPGQDNFLKPLTTEAE